MKTYEQTRNMEFGEQVLRGGVGLIMIEVMLLTPALTPVLIAGLSLTALYMVFTAIMGWDPIYSVAHSSQPRGEAFKAEVMPYSPQKRYGGAPDYKKAA